VALVSKGRHLLRFVTVAHLLVLNVVVHGESQKVIKLRVLLPMLQDKIIDIHEAIKHVLRQKTFVGVFILDQEVNLISVGHLTYMLVIVLVDSHGSMA
jgi:hypothetical protein